MKTIGILKLSPYSYPEQISSSHLSADLNEAFKEAGFHTTVYTPTPCRGIDEATRNKYKKIKHEKMAGGSIDLYRFPMFKEGKNPVGRAFRYLLCDIIQYNKGKKAQNIDIVFTGSTPPTQGLLCGRVAKKLSKKNGKHVPFIYHLQDVFPDSLVTTGLTSEGSFIWKIGRRIEDRTYRYADSIIVISEDIKRNIIKKGVPEEKIVVIPNWIDTNAVHPVPRAENKLFDELGIDKKKFIIVYAGNLGKAQGIDSFINAAKQIANVEFLIFGEGSCKEEFINECKGYSNIHMYPLLPIDRVSEVYSMGNLCLIACKKGTGKGAVPSKTFSIMATGTPILLNFDKGSELWELIEKNHCGYCSDSGDVNGLVDCIRSAMKDSDALQNMGLNARNCVECNYSKEVGTASIISVFNKVLK